MIEDGIVANDVSIRILSESIRAALAVMMKRIREFMKTQ